MCQLRCAGQLFSGLRFPSMFRREYVNAYSCTSFCQERSGEISCEPCAEHTQRYIGVLSGADRRACQCKEGAIFCHQSAVACACLYLSASASTGPPTAGYHNARLEAGEVRCSRHRSFPCAASYESGFAGVCEMYEGASANPGCFAVGCTHSARLPCVESAMCLRAGPVSVSCPGRLSPPFRDSGSASPFLHLARASLGQTFEQTTRRLQRFGLRCCYRRLTLGLSWCRLPGPFRSLLPTQTRSSRESCRTCGNRSAAMGHRQ